MYTANSTDMKAGEVATADLYKKSFVLENGESGEKIIINPFLDNDIISKQRAMAEFLLFSYNKRSIDFGTYITHFEINKVIKIGGLKFIIIKQDIDANEVSIINKYEGVRYEL